MAPLKVSTSTFFKNSTKPKHPFYLIIIFLVLSIFLLLFCSKSSDDSLKVSSATDTSSTNIPIITKRQLLSSTSSVSNLNNKKVTGDTSTLPVSSSSKRNRKVKFEGDAHEVPSGPNPISNR